MASATDGSGGSLTYAGIDADVLDISWSGMERDMIEATHLGSSEAKEFIAARLYDAGSITAELQVDDIAHVTAAKTYQSSAQAIGVSFLDVGGLTVSVSLTGYIQSVDPLNITNGEKVTASVTFKLTGEV